ncbi:MAG: YMGG-like glycine zipper-containing protein [Blastocatellia bacterium]
MNKMMSKRAILMMMLFGMLLVATVSDVSAKDKCRKQRGRVVASNYYDNDYNRNYDRNYQRDRRGGRDYYYEDDENTTGRALRRTGIGAGIGAAGGALLGGKKGALIGAGAGAGAGYIYHRVKVNRQRNRY